jgi:hypothetical protein
MAGSERIPRRSIPFQTCPACGSTWFREATFHQWPAASSAGAMPMTLMPQTMLVCLCGTPPAKHDRTLELRFRRFLVRRGFRAVNRRFRRVGALADAPSSQLTNSARERISLI